MDSNTFQIPPNSKAIKISVVIEFIRSSTARNTSGLSATILTSDNAAHHHLSQTLTEPSPIVERIPQSNPGGAVFATGSWVIPVHMISSHISMSSEGKSEAESASGAEVQARPNIEVESGNNQGNYANRPPSRLRLMSSHHRRPTITYLQYIVRALSVFV